MADPASPIKLTDSELTMLRQTASAFSEELSVVYDRPNKGVARSLERKGMLRNVMDTFWKLTPEGKARLAEEDSP
jgi:hypothetical protein